MKGVSRRKAVAWEVAALTGWMTLPSIPYLFVALPFAIDPISKVSPVANVNFTLHSVALCLPLLFVLWSSGDGGRQFGFDRFRWRVDPALAIGLFALGALVYFPLQPLFREQSLEFQNRGTPQGLPIALSIASLVLVAAFEEELFFRGYLIPRLEELTGKTWVAIVVSAAVFGGGHFYQGMIGGLGAFLFGLLFGVVFTARRSIWPLTLAHAALNAALTYVTVPS